MNGEAQYKRAGKKARDFIDLLIYGDAVSKGLPYSVGDAHAKAGFKGKSSSASAVTRHRYRFAIEWLKGKLSRKSSEPHRKAIERLERVVNANLKDIFTKGLELTDDQWDKLPREISWLVESVAVDREKRKVKLKFKSWSEAEKMLARLAGYDKPLKIEVRGTGDFRADVAEAIGGSKEDKRLLAMACGEDPEVGDD